ncbi:MAG TPA: glycosyl hydrolase family 18 protein, partial [Candidatus Limnocylindrales bacterium]
RFVRSLASALLAATLVATALPGPPAVVAVLDAQPAPVAPADATPVTPVDATPVTPADVAGATDTLGQHPSIAYEEAMAHANDKNAFQPGGRVEVGFAPRAGDRWPVDGHVPTALPAGRATGRQMAASREGTTWADVSTTTAGSGATSAAGTAAPGATADTNATPDPAASPVPADPIPAPADPSASPEATSGPVDAPAGGPAIPATGVVYTAPEPAPALETAAASGLTRQVFGFLPYWELSGASSKLNYDVLSTIGYFSVGADSNGNLRKKNSDGTTTTGWGGWTSSSLTSVINDAHAHGTRVVLTLSVFAWTTSQASVQKALLGSATARLNFAKQAAAAVRDRGADGINLDFEPLASTYSDEFVALLRTVRSELNKVGSGYQLTYDTTGYIGNYPLEASVAAGAADAIFIMGYDYRTSSSSTAGSIDPLSGTGYDLADTVRAYTARVSPSRIILGLPWYGRAWSTVSDAVRSKNQSGEKYGYSAAVNYESLVALVAKYGRRWDPAEQSPYIVYRRENCTSTYGCVTSWRQVYYEDAASMSLRYALVNDYNLRGAGMWALGYDGGNPELYRAVSESFLVDKAAPQAGVINLAAAQADEGFVVSWTARDATAVATYDVQVSVDGGAWVAWIAGTRATSEVWLGGDGHGYAFRVRATDTKGNVGAWNVTSVYDSTPSIAVGGFGRVAADGLAYRTGPDTSAGKLGTLSAGTIVAFTRGPVSADGYTWYEVTQPIAEWSPVSFVERGVWLAVNSSTTTYVTAYRAPNSTAVDAGLTGLDFGTGASAVGTASSAVSRRQLSPNGDGFEDGLRLRWTNSRAFDTMLLNVYRLDGTLVGSRAVAALAAGARTWDWDGRAGASVVPDGRYVLQLVGTAAGRTYRAPSNRPVTTAQVAAYAVTVDTTHPHTTYVPLAPARLLDTRSGTGLSGPFKSGTARTFQVTGRGGVPAGAVAV